jgi:hypothetical protein
MIKLLQSPLLRKFQFYSVNFTNTLSQAVAEGLEELSEITDLSFYGCSFPEGGGAVIASVLKTNTRLKCLDFFCETDEAFYEVLAAALLSNSTLQNLAFSTQGRSNCSRLSPLFLALQVNNELKKLNVFGINLFEEKLSTAMRLGLGKNSTLESLVLSGIQGHNDTCLWREALSFLRTNTALKTLQQEIPEFHHHGGGDVLYIFDLNRAGRRYLVQDGSSISKGVDVMSRVSSDINSVFLHLLENPRLCDRSAIEISSTVTDNARSTNIENTSGGK